MIAKRTFVNGKKTTSKGLWEEWNSIERDIEKFNQEFQKFIFISPMWVESIKNIFLKKNYFLSQRVFGGSEEEMIK